MQLLVLLCHRYPRVRKLTAEKLYIGLMSADGAVPEEAEDEVSDILTSTHWDAELTQARGQRNRICQMVGVEPPKLKAKTPAAAAASAAKAKAKDDLASYQDLVDRTGY